MLCSHIGKADDAVASRRPLAAVVDPDLWRRDLDSSLTESHHSPGAGFNDTRSQSSGCQQGPFVLGLPGALPFA